MEEEGGEVEGEEEKGRTEERFKVVKTWRQ